MKLINKLKIKNGVIFKICGYNIERTMNFLCEKGVNFLEFEKTDLKHAKVRIKKQDEKYFLQIISKLKIEVISKKDCGVNFAFSFLKKRFGLLIGLFLVFACFIVLNNFLFRIEVYGCENTKESEIVSLLNEKGYHLFRNMNSFNNEDVEKCVMDNFNNVSMVSAIKRGNSIVLNIKEKLLNDEYENLDDLEPLKSTKNGIITNITLIQGTLLVKVGDIVKVGDELVAPYTIDSNGNTIPIMPKASISLNSWVEGKVFQEKVEKKVERTGNYVSQRETKFLGVTIFSNFEKEVNFKNYERVEKQCYLSNFILPIKYREVFYFETKCDIINVNFEDVKQKKIDEAKNLALQNAEGKEILSESVNISETPEMFIIDYIITIKDEI